MEPMIREQEAVVRALRAPESYPGRPGRVEHLQTHVSHVFLAGDDVYKLKKAVRFPFLDFSTLAARERFCREEVRLNRRLAPDVYLGVVPVTRTEAGGVELGGRGEPVDWLVHMRRLPADRTLAAMVERGEAAPETLAAVARHMARFHAAAAPADGGDPERLAAAWDENLAGARGFVGRALAAEDAALLADFGTSFVARHEAVLRARAGRGRVRDGHGDLRAEHVYVLGGAHGAIPAGIHVVDCVEFSPAFRAVDVAADVAFLVMELEALARPDLASAFVRAYADAADDRLVPALVPYYACHRAIVRGKVEALASDEAEVPPAERQAAAERARARFALACRFAWRSGEPVVIACAGLSGGGKSTIAAVLAAATGFPVLASDVLRKEGGRTAEYAAPARAAVYGRLRRAVEARLVAGESVIADATFLERAERDRLARLARAYGRRCVFVECSVDEAVARARLERRDGSSVSDARVDVYLRQRALADPFGDDEPVVGVDTGGDAAAIRADLLPRLWAWRQGRPAARRAG
jgi:hypothetical protein